MHDDPPTTARVRRLPPAFSKFEHERLEAVPAGVRGKVSVLRLRFEHRRGRTRLAGLYATGSQQVQRVHYLDEALPDLAVVFVQSVGGGILQGDRLGVEIELGAGARALVTTQSATKVYRMERNYATQRVAVRVERDAHLELLTDYLIPYEGARLYSEIDLTVAPGGNLIYSDGVAPGRVASGERLAYRLVHTRLEARGGGALRLADTTVLAPAQVAPGRPGLLGGHTDLGSLCVLSSAVPGEDLARQIHAGLEATPGVTGGASALPRGDGVSVRALGSSSWPVQAALHQAWRTSRRALLDVDVPPISTLKYGSEPPTFGGRERGGTG